MIFSETKINNIDNMESVDEVQDSISGLEKEANKLKQVDLGLGNWTKQFDKFKRELKGKAGEIEQLTKKIMSFNDWDDEKGLDRLAKRLDKLKKEYDTLVRTAISSASGFQVSFGKSENSNSQKTESDTKTKKEDDGFSFGDLLNFFGGTAMLKTLVSDMINVRGECQKLERAFETMLGSKEKSTTLMSQLIQTAAKSPSDLQEVTNGAKQLLAYGTEATNVNEILSRLGDISFGLSIPLGDMVGLYGSVQTQGKLFAKDVEQFMSRGVPLVSALASELNKTEGEIHSMVEAGQIGFPEVEQAIRKMTSEGGQFYGIMEKQSQTLSGQMSNLSDAWNQMLNSIGEDSQGVLTTTISMTTGVVENYKTIGKILQALIGTYSIYRIAVLLNAIINEGFNKAIWANVKATKAATVAQAIYNNVCKMNPWVGLGAIVVSLGLAVWALSNSTSAAEKAQKQLNKEHEEAAQRRQELASKTDDLVSKINNETDTVYSQVKAYKELLKLYPELANMSFEEFKGMSPERQKQMFSHIGETREVNDASSAYEADLKRIEVLKNNISIREALPDSGEALWKLNKQLEAANALARLHKEEIDKIKEAQWEANTPVEEKVKHYEEVRRNLVEERDELEKTLAKSENIAGVWLGLPDIIGNVKLDVLNKQIENTSGKINSLTGTSNLGVKNKSYWENKRREAEDARNTLDVSEKNSADWNKYTREIQQAQKEIAKYDMPNDGKNRLEQQKAIATQLLDLRRQNQQDEINLRAEGSAKKLAQIELDYDNETAIILAKEQEWKNAQKGALTTDQTKEIHSALTNAWVKKENSFTSVTDNQNTAETKAMNEYLIAYGDYEAMRKAIRDKYTAEITDATTEGEKKTLGKEMIKSLSDLDLKANETTSAISRLFSDMGNWSVTEMRAIADEGEKALRFLEGGTWDDSTGKELNMSRETFDHLSGSLEELESIRVNLVGIRTGADQCDTAFNRMGIGLKKIFEAKGDERDMVVGMELLRGGFDKAMQAGQFLSGTLGSLGESFGNETLSGMATGLNVAMEAADAAMQGAQAGAMFGPMGAAAGAAVGAVTSLVSSFAKIHDARNEKHILQLQDQIEALDKSYEKLGESVEKAYSKDASALIDQQNQLLEQQKVLIEQQIREEEDKKKTDNERIKEWREEQEEINKTLADNKEKAKDAVMGEDLKAAIDNFAQAYADAWSTGEDRAKSAKDVVKNMIKQMVMESLKAAAADPMKAIREKLLECWSDNYISDSEQAYLDQKTAELTAMLDSQFGWADKYMTGEDEKEPTDGVSGQLQAAMTEGTASQLVGLWNSTSMDMRVLRDIGVTTAETVSAMLTDVREIIRVNTLVEQHTRRGADNTTGLIDELRGGFVALDTRLSSIERNTKASYSRG